IGEDFRSRVFEHVVSDDIAIEIQLDDELALQELRREMAGLSPMAQVAKRIFDLVIATVGLVILSPWLTLVAISIKIDSDGPVLVRQVRYDFNRRPFGVFKFRTTAMTDDGTNRRTPAVTRVGQFLRRTNIDELPALINVLRGEMSIIGPRPLITAGPQEY